MRDDFAVFILSHGRADRVLTYETLRTQGYTGRIYIVVDTQDSALARYVDQFGEQVLVFRQGCDSRDF